jgi:hypothetical protein
MVSDFSEIKTIEHWQGTPESCMFCQCGKEDTRFTLPVNSPERHSDRSFFTDFLASRPGWGAGIQYAEQAELELPDLFHRKLGAQRCGYRCVCLLKQRSSITIYRLPTKVNKLPFSVSVLRKQTEVCRFQYAANLRQ